MPDYNTKPQSETDMKADAILKDRYSDNIKMAVPSNRFKKIKKVLKNGR